MHRVIRTSTAERDLVEIGVHIAQDSVAAALRVLDRIEAHCQALAGNPHIGQLCPQFGPEIRQSTVGSYVVFHQLVENDVIIVRVLHGARDIASVFGRKQK